MTRTPPAGDNLILIGMPGAGKSTLGRLLAKRLAMTFLDLDQQLEQQHQCPLQTLVNRLGRDGFRAAEEACVLGLQCQRTVIATGGSVVYSPSAMSRLQQLGQILWLDVPLPLLQQRLHNMDQRGLVIAPGQDLAALYRERLPLYQRWADLRFDGPIQSLTAEVARLAQRLTPAPP